MNTDMKKEEAKKHEHKYKHEGAKKHEHRYRHRYGQGLDEGK